MTALPLERALSRVKAQPVPAHLKELAKERIAHFVSFANNKLGAQVPMPTCSFDLRGRVAGKAVMGYSPSQSKDKNRAEPYFHVQLNAVLFTENVQLFLDDTIPHEVAHLVADSLYGRRISEHGKEWQSVMALFGRDPVKRHNMDVTNARVHKLFELTCGCKTFNLSARRFRQALTGRLRCTQCAQPLRYTGRVKPPGKPWQEMTLQELGVPAHLQATAELVKAFFPKTRA